MEWFNSPQYLKGLQKIRAVPQSRRAVTQTLIDEAAGLYADVDMQKQLSAMSAALRDTEHDRSYELAGDRLSLREDAIDFEKGQYKTAEGLGWANVGLSGLVGYADMKNRKKLAKELQGIAGLYK